MRKILAAALAAALLAAGCTPKNPDPIPEVSKFMNKPAVTFTTAEICVDKITLIRQEDARCTEGLDIFVWVYITDAPGRDPFLPAVGEAIVPRRGSTTNPNDPSTGRVPREGGRFTSP